MFVMFTNPHTKQPIAINRDLVRVAFQPEGRKYVRLVFDKGNGSEHGEEVEGSLQTVFDKLTKEPPTNG